MRRHARSCFNALTKAGFKCYDPVKHRPSWGDGHFDISAEECDPRIDYYINPCMEEVQEICKRFGCYAEWCNSGVVTVYDN